MADFVSKTKAVPYNEERIFQILSDLSNIERIRERIPEDKIEGLEYDTDSCSLSVAPFGRISFRIVGREPYKTVKFATTDSPVPLLLWIQLKQVGENDTRMRLTVRADLSPLIRPVVSKPLQDAVEKISTVLASLPY